MKTVYFEMHLSTLCKSNFCLSHCPALCVFVSENSNTICCPQFLQTVKTSIVNMLT